MQQQQGGAPRKPIITRSKVAAGSVWETRMRLDEVKGGIKVFNAADDVQDGLRVYRRLRRNQSDGAAATATAEKRKRKSWRPPESPPASAERSPIQLRKARSDLTNSPGTSDRSPGRVGEKRVLLIGDGREDGVGGDDTEWEDDDEIEIDSETRSCFDDKEIDMPAEKPKNVEEERTIDQIHEIPIASLGVPKSPAPPPPPPPPVKNQQAKDSLPTPSPLPVKHQQIKDLNPTKPPPVEIEDLVFERMPPPQNRKHNIEDLVFERMPLQQNRMQNIVDLVMWRDISRTAFVFGIGTFILLSSSYTRDLKFSLISSISYLGLAYLAAIFLYRSILRRGSVEIDERDGEWQIVGEEEAIWLLRLLLPHVNELLIRLRSLFSGDPATTMKMAVVLFVMARCGSSITIWTLVKMVFFGVFTIPKVCSAYKTQLSRYGIFWLERFRDGWESCTHKKAVAAAAFTLIWNVSSIVARVWAVFMVVVMVRFYQQRKMEGWSVDVDHVVAKEEERQEDSKTVRSAAVGGGGPARHRQMRSGPTVRDQVKTKKWT